MRTGGTSSLLPPQWLYRPFPAYILVFSEGLPSVRETLRCPSLLPWNRLSPLPFSGIRFRRGSLSLPSGGTFRSFQGFRPEAASRFPGIFSPSEAHSQLHGRTTQTLLTFLESSDDLFLDFLSLLRLSLRPISINQLNTLLCLHL